MENVKAALVLIAILVLGGLCGYAIGQSVEQGSKRTEIQLLTKKKLILEIEILKYKKQNI